MAMREIKFRGQDEHGEWHFGDLLSWPIIRSFNGWNYEYKEVAADTVGQYTGKKDVNKKEIFEGDVVYFLDDRAHERIGVIKWHEKMCCWIIDCGEAGRDMLAYYACEIRGNVHDNPELVEAHE